MNINQSTLGLIIENIEDPRVILALEYCRDQITEPPLNLAQIRQAIGVIRPGGIPCARTIQRWV